MLIRFHYFVFYFLRVLLGSISLSSAQATPHLLKLEVGNEFHVVYEIELLSTVPFSNAWPRMIVIKLLRFKCSPSVLQQKMSLCTGDIRIEQLGFAEYQDSE